MNSLYIHDMDALSQDILVLLNNHVPGKTTVAQVAKMQEEIFNLILEEVGAKTPH